MINNVSQDPSNIGLQRCPQINKKINNSQDAKEATDHNCVDLSHIHNGEIFRMIFGDLGTRGSEWSSVVTAENDIYRGRSARNGAFESCNAPPVFHKFGLLTKQPRPASDERIWISNENGRLQMPENGTVAS